MRLIASIASLVLLALGILVLQGTDLPASFGWGSHRASAGLLQLHLFSAGEGHVGALHGIRPVGNRILVNGERIELSADSGPGLRLLIIDAAGQLGEWQHFSVSRDAKQLDRLIECLESAPMDSALALTVVGRVEPLPDAGLPELRERLMTFFPAIGAQSQPANQGRCSFAYLFLRRPQGFVPLAESFSTVRGVKLSFQLQADRSVYDKQRPVYVRDERGSIFLTPAAARGKGLKREPKLHLGARPFSALSVPVSLETPGLIQWRLGSDAAGPMQSPFRLSFESRVGLSMGGSGKASGVRFELLVDGRTVAERVLIDATAGEQGWDLWSTTLDPELRQVDRVQIRMTRFGPEGTEPLRAYLGQPRMLAGSTGVSPR